VDGIEWSDLGVKIGVYHHEYMSMYIGSAGNVSIVNNSLQAVL
jgi:hypothetical protein